MLELNKILKSLIIDKTWTLFLDRDGVINKHIIGDYVRTIEQFEVLPGVYDFISDASQIFSRIVIITNQQGVGKGLMTKNDLDRIHETFMRNVEERGGRVDSVFACCHLQTENCECRKPKPGLAFQAKDAFPEIDFTRTIMIGDSESDKAFAQNANIHFMFV